ncbi:MAG: hypothetical protein NTV25_02845 [Methanothrix sp.]|nr:hypothetical protein [Methanothrix sp.]
MNKKKNLTKIVEMVGILIYGLFLAQAYLIFREDLKDYFILIYTITILWLLFNNHLILFWLGFFFNTLKSFYGFVSRGARWLYQSILWILRSIFVALKSLYEYMVSGLKWLYQSALRVLETLYVYAVRVARWLYQSILWILRSIFVALKSLYEYMVSGLKWLYQSALRVLEMAIPIGPSGSQNSL